VPRSASSSVNQPPGSHWLRRRWQGVVAVAACMTFAAAGCGSAARKQPAAATVSLPGTPAGTQARWLLGALKHAPIPAAEITAHFDHTFLAQVTPAKLNTVFTGVRSVQLDSVTASTPGALVFMVTANRQTRLNVSMNVDARGLISGLVLRPAGATPSPPPVPSSWGGVDHAIRSVAPQVRFLAAVVSGSTCQPVRSIHAGTAAPLGSAFKLYVLDALARAVASGRVSWKQQLTITSSVKSLPSGILQNRPDGTRLSVQQVATDMISISDNTATNMLMALLGRGAVEAAARDTGMASPARDVPFLTTREMFVLKLHDWPGLADRYLAGNAARRQALLAGTVDRVPLSALSATPWITPRDINSIEWFASPTDICHVYASLASRARQPKLAPLAHILGLNSGGIGLSGSQWRAVWFKGGSEPGVLTLNYLATTRSGKTYMVSVLTENPASPISETPAALTLLSAIKGAFTLAAG
jgi:Beta-lactamase enzyme family/ORF 12 gene product N-terminal